MEPPARHLPRATPKYLYAKISGRKISKNNACSCIGAAVHHEVTHCNMVTRVPRYGEQPHLLNVTGEKRLDFFFLNEARAE